MVMKSHPSSVLIYLDYDFVSHRDWLSHSVDLLGLRQKLGIM